MILAMARMSEDDVTHGGYSEIMEDISRMCHDKVLYSERNRRGGDSLEQVSPENGAK